jgi:hypothetical protein
MFPSYILPAYSIYISNFQAFLAVDFFQSLNFIELIIGISKHCYHFLKIFANFSNNSKM